MIIQTEKFQEACKKILDAVDSNDTALISDTLELETKDRVLKLNVTNKEYYVSVSLPLDCDVDLHVVVDAQLFLNLISKITTKELELTCSDTTLVVKANGTYKLPLIFENDKLLELPKIIIGELTNQFKIKNSVLQSILKYNTKELQKSGIKKMVQKMFYIDEQGCITFTNGACINTFALEKSLKMVLSEKIVKLFKLFKDEEVDFTMGFDVIGDGMNQTKVKFKDSTVELTTILTDSDKLISDVPVTAIRGMGSSTYQNVVTLKKEYMVDAISRLSLFSKKDVSTLYTYLVFDTNGLTIYDTRKENYEVIPFVNEFNIDQPYECILNTNDFRITLESTENEFVSIQFGNHRAIMIERDTVKNIIPECNKR